jgi:hypothetical protein
LRTKQKERKKKDLLFGSQKSMIEFTDLFCFALPLLIVVQPALHHLPLPGADTELPVTATRISDGQNPDLVAFALFTARASLAVEDGALQQRAA